MGYHVWDAILEHYRRHNAKAGQHHAELKDRFVADIQNDLLHAFIDRQLYDLSLIHI